MKLIMIKGFSKTGKTTTTEALIKELIRRGYSVATVKDIHAADFTMEQKGTDTWRHKQAGADPVTARGRTETNITYKGALDIDKILKCCSSYCNSAFYGSQTGSVEKHSDINPHSSDFVVLEGDSGADCPVILTGRTIEDLEQRWDENAIAISGVISGTIKEYKGRPAIDATKEIERLVNLVEEKTKAASTSDVELRLNGEDIPMVPFVEKIIQSVVEGLVKDLKGYKPGADIEIKIKGNR